MAGSPDSEVNKFWAFVQHPRTNLIAAIIVAALGLIAPRDVGYLLLVVAALLVIRSAWEWQPVRDRVPVDFQSPVVRRDRVPKPKPVRAELGKVDFELRMQNAAKDVLRIMGEMTKEMGKIPPKITKQTANLVQVQGAPVEKRLRVLSKGGKVISGHAHRLADLEAAYRRSVNEQVTNSKKIIEGADPGDDFDEMAEGTAGLRATIVENKRSMTNYKTAIQGLRSQNMSQSMNGACDELLAVLDRVNEDNDTWLDYCDWVAAVAAERSA